MAVQIDFKSITLQDALDLAVLIEEEARARYVELADQMVKHDTPGPARFFLFMAKNEEKHRDELTARRRELFGDKPARVRLGQLFDVEAPEYHEARAYMPVIDALNVALRAEEKAFAFFAAASRSVNDLQVKALFEELRDEEVVHQQLVQAQIDRAPEEGPISAEDVADEPHAH